MHTIDCPHCEKRTPEAGKYCMHCGTRLVVQSNVDWPGDILKIPDDADTAPFMIRHFGGDVEHIASVEAVRWVFEHYLSTSMQQVVIRTCNLDGNGGRTYAAIAREIGWTPERVSYRDHIAWRVLHDPPARWVLLGERLVPRS